METPMPNPVATTTLPSEMKVIVVSKTLAMTVLGAVSVLSFIGGIYIPSMVHRVGIFTKLKRGAVATADAVVSGASKVKNTVLRRPSAIEPSEAEVILQEQEEPADPTLKEPIKLPTPGK